MRCVPFVVPAFFLLAPAAHADGFETLQDLAGRRATPADVGVGRPARPALSLPD
jgi:hypothetical protein